MHTQDAAVRIRSCRPGDAGALHALAGRLPPLTVHTAYTYWSLCRYAGATCFIAETDEGMVGMVTGMLRTADPATLFIWQLGVAPGYRGTGLADRLLDRMAGVARHAGAQRLEFTIARANLASRKAFERLASRLDTRLVEVGVAQLPEPIASVGNPEILYRMACG